MMIQKSKLYDGPLVSVIVPVYNAEKQLNRCIKSLVNQSYQNLQILLIDDGSEDGSGRICDEWAKKDGRICVIHQENSGVSSARNTGIENATGKYISFVDSDDFVVENIYDIMVKKAEQTDSDQVCCNIKNFYNGKFVEEEHVFGETTFGLQKKIYENMIVPLLDPEKGNGRECLLQSTCNKIYRRSTILQNNIRFNCKIRYAEDYLFNVNFYRFAVKVSFVREHLYVYDRSTEGSLSKRFRHDAFENSVYIRKIEKEWFPYAWTRQEYAMLILNIQMTYIFNFVSVFGIKGLSKYMKCLYVNQDLREAYKMLPKKGHCYSIPQKAVNSENVKAYIAWGYWVSRTHILKHYIKYIYMKICIRRPQSAV